MASKVDKLIKKVNPMINIDDNFFWELPEEMQGRKQITIKERDNIIDSYFEPEG